MGWPPRSVLDAALGVRSINPSTPFIPTTLRRALSFVALCYPPYERKNLITIVGNSQLVCKKTAQDILFALINREFGPMIGKFGKDYGKWTKDRMVSEIMKATNGKWVCEFMAINNYAAPNLTGDVKMYEYRHRLPIDGKWSDINMVLRFHLKGKSSYDLELLGFTR